MNDNEPQQDSPCHVTEVAPCYLCYSPLSPRIFLQHCSQPKTELSLRVYPAFKTMDSYISKSSTHLQIFHLGRTLKTKLQHSRSATPSTRGSVQVTFEISATASLAKMPTQGMLYRWEDNAVGRASTPGLIRCPLTTNLTGSRPQVCHLQDRLIQPEGQEDVFRTPRRGVLEVPQDLVYDR